MRNRSLRLLLIFVILIVVVIIDFPILTNFKESIFGRRLDPNLGLDLRGGMQVVMQAPEGYQITQETLEVASTILENRSNALGVSEVVFQVAGDNYIVGEFPGLENISEVIEVIKQTGMLEFVDVGSDFLPPGSLIQTDFGQPVSEDGVESPSAPAPLDLGQANISPQDANTSSKVYHTVITGGDLASVSVLPPQAP